MGDMFASSLSLVFSQSAGPHARSMAYVRCRDCKTSVHDLIVVAVALKSVLCVCSVIWRSIHNVQRLLVTTFRDVGICERERERTNTLARIVLQLSSVKKVFSVCGRCGGLVFSTSRFGNVSFTRLAHLHVGSLWAPKKSNNCRK